MSATLPGASTPITSSVAVTDAAFTVTIFHSCSSVKWLSKYVLFSESAQRSSRSRFIEPVGIQSVPSAISTPSRAAVVTRAVSPYSVMFERGEQISAVLAAAMAARACGLSPIAWIMAGFGHRKIIGAPGGGEVLRIEPDRVDHGGLGQQQIIRDTGRGRVERRRALAEELVARAAIDAFRRVRLVRGIAADVRRGRRHAAVVAIGRASRPAR